MEHIAAIMLLVGCSHGGLACEELSAPQVAYESMEDCVGALPAALGGAGAGKRIVHGRCAAIDPAWMEEDVEVSVRAATTQTVEAGAPATVTAAPQSVSVGLVMTVTPQISDNDEVILNVRPTISSISDFRRDPNPSIPSNIANLVPQILIGCS